MDSDHALHRNTPKLVVVDPRGLAIATVAYYRESSAEVQPEPRVTRETFDVVGRSVANWDARLGSGSSPIPSLTLVPALTGTPLLRISVDAGWRLALQNEAEQVRQHWDGAGNTTGFDYDLMGRPVSVEQASACTAGQCVERLYYGAAEPEVSVRNQCGRLIRHADTAGTWEVSDYNLQGAPLSESRRFLAELDHPGWPVAESEQHVLLEQGEKKTYLTQRHYDALGETLAQIDAAGHIQRFAYTVHGHLQSTWLAVAGKSEQLLVSDISYNASGQIERETAGNGVVSSSHYDPSDGRLRQLLSFIALRRLQDLRYDYDPVGNILCMTDESQPVSWFANQRVDVANRYGYDTLYQLTSATGREVASATDGPTPPDLISPPDPSRLQNFSQKSWCYDAGGNLLEQRHSGKPTHFMDIDTVSNRGLKRVEGQVPNFDASFDRNGNLKFLAPGQPLRWTVRNQLDEAVLVTRTDGQDDSERYVYDATGMRVRKVRVAQAASVFRTAEVRYLPGLEIHTEGAVNPDEVLHVVSVQAGRSSVRLLHWKLGQPDEIEEDQLRYSLDDYLGSCTLELDNRGHLISYEGYYAYGETAWWMGRSQVEAKYKMVRYSGKEHDATRLYYYGFRYYLPGLQRWINPDPAGTVDGLNVFCMVGNNPISYRDATGLYRGHRDLHEQQVEIDYKIVARGREQLSDAQSERLDSAIDLSRKLLKQSVMTLNSGGESLKKIHLLHKVTGITPEQLDEDIHSVVKTMPLYLRDGARYDQVVFVKSRKGLESAAAFVLPGDKEKRIFLTPLFFEGDLRSRTRIWLHERWHEQGKAEDFFFYRQSVDGAPFISDKFSAYKTEGKLEEAIELTADQTINDGVASKLKSGRFGGKKLKEIFGTINPWLVAKGVSEGDYFRNVMIRRNADTFAMAVLFLGQAALHKP